jgi:hypothetical protein
VRAAWSAAARAHLKAGPSAVQKVVARAAMKAVMMAGPSAVQKVVARAAMKVAMMAGPSAGSLETLSVA